MTLADDELRLAQIATTLADAIDASIRPWLHRLIAQRANLAVDDVEAARVVDETARMAVGRVRTLLATDIDEQRSNPLAVLRASLGPVTALLGRAGATPVERDSFVASSFPDDRFDLAPAAFSDIDESLHEPGLMWGAAKAHVHLARRRADGLL